MLFSEAIGRKVVSTDTATTVGIVTDYVVDPALPGVVALTLAKTAVRATPCPGPASSRSVPTR